MFTKEWVEKTPINRRTAISLIAITFSKVAQKDVSREIFTKCMGALGVSEKECLEIEQETFNKINRKNKSGVPTSHHQPTQL
jgi:hypothetical protein